MNRAFIQALADECAQALDRARLHAIEAEARREAEFLALQRQEFVSVTSHELTTPLASRQGYVELLERQVARPAPDADRIARYVVARRQAASRLGALVNDMLDVSRIQQEHLRLHPTACDLAEVARDGHARGRRAGADRAAQYRA